MGIRSSSLLFSRLLCILILIKLGNSDINKDKQECTSQLVGLATCLPFATGHAKAPTPDCCVGLRQTVKDSKKCLCLLVKDRDDPSLGLNINATLALSLPDRCKAANPVAQCPALLHLAPNDPEAKVFNDFAKAAAPSTSTTTPASPGITKDASSAKDTNDGGKKNEMSAVLWRVVLVWCSYLTIIKFI